MGVARGGYVLFFLIPAWSLRTVTQHEGTSTAFLEELRLKKSNAVEKINSQIKYNLEHSNEIRKQYQEKARVMTDAEIDELKTSTVNYLTAKKKKVGGWTVVGVVIDALILMAKMVWGTCELWASILWWAMGLAVLMADNNLHFWDAFFLLGQQITTVGYGSSGPKLDENNNTNSESAGALAIWHGLHSVVATSIAGNYYKAVTDKYYAKYLAGHGCDAAKEEEGKVSAECQAAKFGMIITLVLASTFGFSFDIDDATDDDGNKVYKDWGDAFLAALYMVFITMTTVGYGDVTPLGNASKFLSVPWMMFGTQLWARSWEDSSWIKPALDFKPLSGLTKDAKEEDQGYYNATKGALWRAAKCEKLSITERAAMGAGKGKKSGKVKKVQVQPAPVSVAESVKILGGASSMKKIASVGGDDDLPDSVTETDG